MFLPVNLMGLCVAERLFDAGFRLGRVDVNRREGVRFFFPI